MAQPEITANSIVIGNEQADHSYGITNSRTILRVLSVDRDSITVEVVGLVESDAGSATENHLGHTFGVLKRNFVLYNLADFGVPIHSTPWLDERMEELSSNVTFAMTKDRARVINKKLKNHNKIFEVGQLYGTGFVHLKRTDAITPIIIRDKNLQFLDKVPEVGGFAVRAFSVNSGGITSGMILKVKHINRSGMAICKAIAGQAHPSMGTTTDFTIPLQQLERLNTTNSRQREGLEPFLGGRSLIEVVNNLVPTPRQFWMVACHTDEGIYPAQCTTGKYAPRRKFYDRTVAENVLREMQDRHGGAFYLLEAVEAATPNGSHQFE